jgi:hypothetical protein
MERRKTMIDIGWTSTREGMSVRQWRIAKHLLERLFSDGSTFHHGDCLGGDQEGFEIAMDMGYFTVAHPPINSKLRAYTKSDLILPEKPYIPRNHDIVGESDLLLACPRLPEKDALSLRSGTWATIRFARTHSEVPVLEILP